jgi:hypothetical protein
MKSLKLAAVAACVAVVALAYTAGASADGICKAKEAPCSLGNQWALGTEFQATIKKGTEFKFDGFRHYTCSVSSRTDQLISKGAGGGVPATVKTLSEAFSGCSSTELGSCTASTASLPESKWFANTEIAGDGYASSPSTAGSITLACVGLTCKWLYSTQISHTYKGGIPAIETLELMYVRDAASNFLCGKETIIKGEREIVSPNSNPVYWTKS